MRLRASLRDPLAAARARGAADRARLIEEAGGLLGLPFRFRGSTSARQGTSHQAMESPRWTCDRRAWL